MSVSILEHQRPETLVDEPAAAPVRGRLLDPWVIGVLAALISVAWSSRPSLWFDESATISASANRTLPELWQMLGHIDAVHGLFYLLMHGWFAIFPPTEFWARFPSCLAIGAAAAGVTAFAKQFLPQGSGRTIAVCAGIVFAILPRTTLAGMEARSYSLVVAVSIWLTVLFVNAVRSNRPRLWLCYAPALMLLILLNLNLILLISVHAAMLPFLAPKESRKSPAIRFGLASAAAVAAMTPYVVFAHSQVKQIDWIYPISWHYAFDIVQRQYFDHSTAFAIFSGVLIGVCLIAWLMTSRRPGRSAPTDEVRNLLIVCVAWMAVPTGILVFYSIVSEPVYYPRYLIFTTPAMAILLGICIVTIATKPWAIAGLLLLSTIAALPGYLFTQRWPYSKEGWDYSQIADVIAAHASPGDCLIVDNTADWKPGPVRASLAARPAAYRPLVDVGRGAYGPKVGSLWDGHVAVWLVTEKIDKCPVLWTITNHDTSLPDHQAGQVLPPGSAFGRAPAYRFPAYLGFHVVERWQFTFAQVVKSTR